MSSKTEVLEQAVQDSELTATKAEAIALATLRQSVAASGLLPFSVKQATNEYSESA